MSTMNSKLKQAIDGLPREIAPGRDLWPGIEHALEKPVQGVRLPAWSIAAALAIFGLTLTWGIMRPGSPSGSADMQSLVALLHSENEQAKEVLLASYGNRPALYPEWQTELAQLEDAEQAILAALAEAPSNLHLLGLLRQVQQKQLNLIDAVYAPRLTSL